MTDQPASDVPVARLHADGSPRRLAECAARNPANDEYQDGCCRFPKSCSPYPYDETPVTDADLEPRRAMTDQPAAATDEEWTCGKPGCELGIDGHDFALALEHVFHEEGLSAEDARGVADRTLDRVARGLGLDDDTEESHD